MQRFRHRILPSAFALAFAALPVLAVDKVQFDVTGADAALISDLRAASLLTGLGASDTAQDILAKAKADYGVLLDALYAQGRYGPVIHILLDGTEAATIAPLDVPDTITSVQVTVDVGPAFALSRAQIAPLAEGTKIPEGFATGKLASSTVILGTATAAIERWRDRGFAKAAVKDQSLVADHETAQVAADITLESGPKLRFGKLTLTGLESMSEARSRAIAGLSTGAVFSPKDLDRAATRLRRTGAFRSVSLTEADQITSPDELDITANLVEEKLRRYRVAGDLASREGLSLSAELMHRNLFGGAERLTLSADATHLGVDTGGLDYELSAEFDRPATFTPDTTLKLGIGFARAKENLQDDTALNLRGGLVHYFSNTLTGKASLAYHISRVIDPSGVTEFRTLSLPFGATWDTRPVKKDATDGIAISAEVKPFYGLGYTESGVRMVWDTRGYKTVSQNGALVLAARVQVGAIFGSSLAGTPREDLFFSGGPATVRGQPYKSLGVYQLTDGSGTPFLTGGTHFLAGSLESRLKIGRNLGLVGFVDVGHIDANAKFSLSDNWHAGAGLGLRYLTTIGPIRLDVAAPISGATGQGLQLYVGLGQAF